MLEGIGGSFSCDLVIMVRHITKVCRQSLEETGQQSSNWASGCKSSWMLLGKS